MAEFWGLGVHVTRRTRTRTKILDPKFFQTQIFFGPNFFLVPKFFSNPKFFQTPNFFLPTFFQDQNFFLTRNNFWFLEPFFFRSKIFSEPKWTSVRTMLGGRKQSFQTLSFLNWQGQRFYLNWSLTLKTKSCSNMLLNEFNDNYDVRYFMSFFYLRYIKNFKNNQNLKVKPLFTNRVIKKTLQGVGKTFSMNNTRVTFFFYLLSLPH